MYTNRRSLLRRSMGIGIGAGLAALTGCGKPATHGVGRVANSLPEVAGAQRLAYGDAPSQWIDVAFPTGAPTTAANEANRATGLIVLVHGGFWSDTYGADLMTPLARDLLERGHPVANLEYRRLGEPGGGWPGTFEDVASGLDRLASAGRELGRTLPGTVVTVGHSAGGQLAVWAAGRHRLGPGAVGGDPAVCPSATVSLAGVLDLRSAATHGVGGDVVNELLGGEPRRVPDHYDGASPMALLPLGVPTRCVHGTADAHVPISQSETYVDAAKQHGDDATIDAIDGADHFVLIDPTSAPWRRVTDWIDRTVG